MTTTVADQIEACLKTALLIEVFELADDSHLHAGHAGNRGGGHYRILVVSPAFAGIGRLQRQRMVKQPLADWFADRWGQQGVYWSHPVASVCTAALALFLLRRLLLDCRKLVMTGTAATAKSDHEGA